MTDTFGYIRVRERYDRDAVNDEKKSICNINFLKVKETVSRIQNKLCKVGKIHEYLSHYS